MARANDMKALLSILLSTLACSLCQAEDLTLSWDANEPEEQIAAYRVYEKIDGAWVLIAETAETEITVTTNSEGRHTYFVTAMNDAGLEGPPTDPALWPLPAVRARP